MKYKAMHYDTENQKHFIDFSDINALREWFDRWAYGLQVCNRKSSLTILVDHRPKVDLSTFTTQELMAELQGRCK